MPKRFSDGHFVRRIRRTLTRENIVIDLGFKDAPEYKTIMPERILETRVHKDGMVYIGHHAVRTPHNEKDLERILWNIRKDPGIPEHEIHAFAGSFGTALRTGEGMYPIVECGISFRHRICVPVKFYDMIGRTHDMVMYHENEKSPFGSQHYDWAELNRKADSRRRNAKGNFKPIKIGRIFASMLRCHPNGLQIAEALLPEIEKSIERSQIPDGMSIISLVDCIGRVKLEDDKIDIDFKFSEGLITLYNCRFPGGYFQREGIYIKGEFPQTLVNTLTGKKLKDVIEGLPLTENLTIASARTRRHPDCALRITVKEKNEILEDVIKELREKNQVPTENPKEAKKETA